MIKKEMQEQNLGLICGSETITKIIVNNFSLANILIFETTSTILFSYIIVVDGGFCVYLSFLISGATLFLSFLWSGRFCGAILNPIVAMLYMVKKQKKISGLKEVLYLICEFVGTIIGSVIGFVITNNHSPAIILLQAKLYNTNTGILFFESFINSCLFCVIILILITKDITFVELQLQIWFTIPIIYTTVSIFGGITVGPNPFFGLIIPFFNCLFTDNWTLMSYIWPLVVAPPLGSIAAYFFFQYFYHRFAYVYKRELKEEQDRKRRQDYENTNMSKAKMAIELV